MASRKNQDSLKSSLHQITCSCACRWWPHCSPVWVTSLIVGMWYIVVSWPLVSKAAWGRQFNPTYFLCNLVPKVSTIEKDASIAMNAPGWQVSLIHAHIKDRENKMGAALNSFLEKRPSLLKLEALKAWSLRFLQSEIVYICCRVFNLILYSLSGP